jgi:hypothetical protein
MRSRKDRPHKRHTIHEEGSIPDLDTHSVYRYRKPSGTGNGLPSAKNAELPIRSDTGSSVSEKTLQRVEKTLQTRVYAGV